VISLFRVSSLAVWNLRCRQSVVNAPSRTDAIAQSLYRKFVSLSPREQMLCLSFVGIESIVALIHVLLASSGPTHITGFVVAVIVGIAVQGMIRTWPLSDISQKCREITKPLFANYDTSASIVFEMNVSRICASLLHIDPRLILRSFVASVSDAGGLSFENILLGCREMLRAFHKWYYSFSHCVIRPFRIAIGEASKRASTFIGAVSMLANVPV